MPISLKPRSRTVAPRGICVSILRRRAVEPLRPLSHVLHVDEEDAVGLLDGVGPRHAVPVAVREVEPPPGVDDPGAEQLRELHELPERVRVAARVRGDDERPLRGAQAGREIAQRRGVRADPRRRLQPVDVRERGVVTDLLLLQAGVERDVHGALRGRRGDAVPAEDRLGDRADRRRLVVPFRVVADDVPLDVRRMDPVDVRPPAIVGHRAGSAEDDHRRAIDRGVVDPHRPLQQADDVVQDHGHRPTGRLRVAVRDSDGELLVVARDQLGVVAAVVDERVMEASKRRAGIERDVRESAGLDRVHHHVRPVALHGFSFSVGQSVRGRPVRPSAAAGIRRRVYGLTIGP